MKPLVYFVDKNNQDKYVLEKEELNKILGEVYQAGYEDGKNSNIIKLNPSQWKREFGNQFSLTFESEECK